MQHPIFLVIAILKIFLLTLLNLFQEFQYFFLSGFLIFGSFEKSQNSPKPLLNFFAKRIIRIYPALIFCFICSFLFILQSGYFETIPLSLHKFILWFIAHASILQFYETDIFQGFGFGELNGSLWTISVVIQFYILTPFIYYFLKNSSKEKIILFIFFFLTMNILNSFFNDRSTFFLKLLSNSFAPWLYMFVVGAMVYKSKKILNFIIKIPYFIGISLLLIFYFLTKDYGWGNDINPIVFFLIVVLLVKFAYMRLSFLKELKGIDISYGIYIFHMPVFNYLKYKNFGQYEIIIFGFLLTLLFSLISWFIVEKPFLKSKKYSLRDC